MSIHVFFGVNYFGIILFCGYNSFYSYKNRMSSQKGYKNAFSDVSIFLPITILLRYILCVCEKLRYTFVKCQMIKLLGKMVKRKLMSKGERSASL